MNLSISLSISSDMQNPPLELLKMALEPIDGMGLDALDLPNLTKAWKEKDPFTLPKY